jgi:type IV pilus assembly protein PilQ
VKDGDTTVIGGIYVRRGSTAEAGVPFLSKIPILGFFFKNKSEIENRQELLIFITPRIINRQTVAQSL